jgi:hypothetical protein
MFSNTIEQLEEHLNNLNIDLNNALAKMDDSFTSDETYDELEERVYELTEMTDAFALVIDYFQNA